jgi:hypothetical protein
MSGTLITNSIYNAINGVSSSGGGGGTGGLASTLIKSGTSAILSSSGTTLLYTLPSGLAEGVYMLEINSSALSTAPANSWVFYLDQTKTPNNVVVNVSNTPLTGGTTIFSFTSGSSSNTTGKVIIYQSGTTTTGTYNWSVNQLTPFKGGSGGNGGSVSGISSLTSGTAISLTGTTTAPTINNTGVTSAVAGTGVSVSSGTGAVTFSNTGVTSAVAGTGIAVSSGTGAVTITNNGVQSLTAGSGVSVSSGTGAVTIANTGVLSVTGTGAGITATTTSGAVTLANTGVTYITGTNTLVSGTNGIVFSNSTGSVVASLPSNLNINSVESLTGNFTTSCNTPLLRNTAGTISIPSNIALSGSIISSGSSTFQNMVLGTDLNVNGYNLNNIGTLNLSNLTISGTLTTTDVSYSGNLNAGNLNSSLVTNNLYSYGNTNSYDINVYCPLSYYSFLSTGSPITNTNTLLTASQLHIVDSVSSCPQYNSSGPYVSGTPFRLVSQWGQSSGTYTDLTNNSLTLKLFVTDYSQYLVQCKIQFSGVLSTGSTGGILPSCMILYPALKVTVSGGTTTILYSNTFNQTTPFIINTSILPPSLSSIKSGTTPITSYAFNFILEDTFNLSSIMNSNNFVVGGSGNNVQFVLYGANGDPSLIDASLNTGFLINVQTEFLLNTNS